jgi:hypothetical protein
MVAVIVIPADETQPMRMAELDPQDNASARALVGGNPEVTGLSDPASDIWCNEDGKAFGLPVNRRATAVTWIHNRRFAGRDVIVGDVYLTGPPDGAGVLTSLPAELATTLVNPASDLYVDATDITTGLTDRWGPFTEPARAYLHGALLLFVLDSDDTVDSHGVQIRVVPAHAHQHVQAEQVRP